MNNTGSWNKRTGAQGDIVSLYFRLTSLVLTALDASEPASDSQPICAEAAVVASTCHPKQVECNDECEANQAFKEACALRELQHPYICGYREFFVEWDKEESAMYFNLVMECYEKGDLDQKLRQLRKEKTSMPEALIKKWLGQIIEVLVNINEKGVIHRDLKPSNLFIKDDDCLALGDFGVATVMGDVRTKTRTAVGSMNWMAPEVMNQPYDERSDIWSLGCITLEMMTCSFMSPLEMSKALTEIKTNQQRLDEILGKASDIYDNGLIGEVRHMLRREFEHRPNAKKLVESPYIAECMAISGSALVDRKRRQAVNTDEKPVPINKGIPGMIAYLEENLVHENCVREALELLVSEVATTPLDNNAKKVVAAALRQNAVCGQICVAACNLLSNSALVAKEDDVIFTEDVFGAVILAMRHHVTSAPIQQAAASLLLACSSHGAGTIGIGDCGGIQALLEAMRMHKTNGELVAVCCNALWSLCVHERNAGIATREQAMMTICDAMKRHKDCPEVLENAIAALLSLSVEDDNVDLAEDLEVIYLLLSSMKAHLGHSKLVKNTCMTLTSFVEADEQCALMAIDCTGGEKKEQIHGLSLLMDAYSTHRDNADVVEAIASVIGEIVTYAFVVEYLIDCVTLSEFVTKVLNRYRKIEAIRKPCEECLKLLRKNA